MPLKYQAMSIYQQAGHIPNKRHVVFRQPNGNLYHEELVGTEGFAGLSSLVYHLHPPTVVKEHGVPYSVRPEVVIEDNLQARSFMGYQVEPNEDYIKSRKTLFVNDDMTIGLAAPSKSLTAYYFKNADADEMIFVHKGMGTLKTMYGKIAFEYGDYLIIPRGTVYQLHFETNENKLLLVESFGSIETPDRYRNNYGQYLEHSPFCERDFKRPTQLETHDEQGDFLINIKKRGLIYPYVYGN
ncbi:MAG: homogentisate 1,2-dioxygenase, partial [Bacteroidia bacterium]